MHQTMPTDTALTLATPRSRSPFATGRTPRAIVTALALAVFPQAAMAQAADDWEDEEGEVEVESAEAANKPPTSPPDTSDQTDGIFELPGETYYFLGARYRLQVVPQFVQHWFAEGGETLWVNTPGIEFAIRQDGFEYNFFGMLGFYSMADVPFKGNSDVEAAWETITADYQVLFIGADFLWSTAEFSPGLSMIYGAGIGIGSVFGEMTRTQAYPDGSGSYAPCVQPGVPDPVYCDGVNNHYNGYVEPSWLDGGSSPLIFPWIAGQVGLRYKFHRNFVARLETGFTVTSVFFGLGADYGL